MIESSDWVPTLLQVVSDTSLYRQTPALRLRIQQLLPGGFPFSYFDQFPEFSALRPLRRAMRQMAVERDVEPLCQVAAEYVTSFEERLLSCCSPDNVTKLEEYQRAFEQALLALAVLNPVPLLSEPVICAISGPSGAGKDTVLKRTIEWLQARGYSARYLTKYVNRSPREAEAGGHPLFRYQVHVGRETEHDSRNAGPRVDAMADAFFRYQRYGNWYAFSRADLEAFAAMHNSPIVFAVMSEYQRLHEFWIEVQSIVEGAGRSLTSMSFLLEATEERSISSLVQRLLSRTKENPAALDEAYGEYQVRRAVVESDYSRIRKDDAMFADYLDINNRRPDNGFSASLQIYQYIGRAVMSQPRI